MGIRDPDPTFPGHTAPKSRILLADDETLLRELLADSLAAEPSLEVDVVDTAGAALARLERGIRYDLVILGYDLPESTQLAAYATIRAAAPRARIAILLNAVWPNSVYWAEAHDCAGFLPKSITRVRLVAAVRALASGRSTGATEFLDTTLDAHPLASRLSARETEALAGLVRGLPNKVIARHLGISEATVKMHVKTLYRKIGAANRTQAAMIARQQGLF